MLTAHGWTTTVRGFNEVSTELGRIPVFGDGPEERGYLVHASR